MTKRKKTISLRMDVIGKDRTGVIAAFTNFLFQHQGNILDLDQAARRGLFKMTLHAEFPAAHFNRREMEKKLIELGKEVGMSVTFHREIQARKQRIVVLVTREDHCLRRLIEDSKKKSAKGEIVAILGNRDDLRPFAESSGIPFHLINGPNRDENEMEILNRLEEYQTDLVVLAKYMRILSPDVVWRYENRMINIHHSLLPAFPGASAYRQAYEKGVKLVGCTAHYVTTDLDQGPIIWQESFRIRSDMKLKDIIRTGFEHEAKCLSKAVRLHLSGKLHVHWGKVYGC